MVRVDPWQKLRELFSLCVLILRRQEAFVAPLLSCASEPSDAYSEPDADQIQSVFEM